MQLRNFIVSAAEILTGRSGLAAQNKVRRQSGRSGFQSEGLMVHEIIQTFSHVVRAGPRRAGCQVQRQHLFLKVIQRAAVLGVKALRDNIKKLACGFHRTFQFGINLSVKIFPKLLRAGFIKVSNKTNRGPASVFYAGDHGNIKFKRTLRELITVVLKYVCKLLRLIVFRIRNTV